MQLRVPAVAVLLAACAAAAALCAPASAAGRSAAPARKLGDRRVFTRIPYPGQPGGLVIGKKRLYVDTFGFVFSGAGDSVPPPTWHRPVDGYDYVFGYDLATQRLTRDRPSAIAIRRTRRAAYMGLSGMAMDAKGDLYVVDMNARVIKIDPRSGRQQVYATFPAGAGGPVATMPLDIAFDRQGFAYVTDIAGLPVIWRIPPGGGEAEPWFVDQRLVAVNTMGGSGIRVDPQGRNLYFAVAGGSLYPATAGHGLLYTLPLDRPYASNLRLLHTYESAAEAPPVGTGPVGLAFGDSGRLYVALPGTAQVSVLKPAGPPKHAGDAPSYREERRFSGLSGAPNFLAFDGRGSLLVTSLGDERPDSWIVWDVFAADRSPEQGAAARLAAKLKRKAKCDLHARRRPHTAHAKHHRCAAKHRHRHG